MRGGMRKPRSSWSHPSIYYRDDDLGPVFAPAPIPEPHTVALLAAGLMALGVGSRLRAARG